MVMKRVFISICQSSERFLAVAHTDEIHTQDALNAARRGVEGVDWRLE